MTERSWPIREVKSHRSNTDRTALTEHIGSESGYGIAVDGSNVAHVVGETNTASFPKTASALQPIFGGGAHDAFVTRITDDSVAPTVKSALSLSMTVATPAVPVPASRSAIAPNG